MGLAGCMGGNGDGSGDGGGDSDGDSGGATTSSGGGGEELDITFATTQPPENISVQTAQEHFIDVIEEETDGRISVNLEAATLGGTEDNLDAIEAGTVDILHESPTALSQRFSSEYSFAGDPFVIEDMEHYRAVNEEFLMPEDGLNGILMENGIQLGPAFYVGNRCFTSNKPVTSPEDVQGLKLRLPQYETWTAVWDEIGADVTPVAYDELYSALQTGVVDASEGPISQFLSVSLYEVQSHFSVTNHLLDTKHFLYNSEFFDGLSDEDRELITSTASDAVEAMTEDIKAEEESLYEQAREEDTTVVTADEVDRDAFVEAGQPALDELSETNWAVDIADIQDLA
ncbi:TRAP transporter substrate-binding protein [Halobellus rufus]|uniref:TRAP transporter substrate-binding protein n=1 Tax=Halobellus rufus TaxID=1448860 RepID=UPI000B2BF96C|nr:TRAP transporter substrate-binding protein [Halobellus rufus]